jgi:hypothetical protein
MAFRLDCITLILCLSSAAFKRILFLMAQNLISITMFLGIDWTETSWRCFLLQGQTYNVGYIFVSYVDIARIPFLGLEADLAHWMFFLLRFFFLSSVYNFLHLPKAGILQLLLFSSRLLCSHPLLQTASGGHPSQFPMSRTSFCFSLRFYTFRDYIPSIASHEEDHSKEYKLFTFKNSAYYLL